MNGANSGQPQLSAGDMSPEELGEEILAVAKQFALLWNSRDRLPAIVSGYSWCSMPDSIEIAILANLIMFEAGMQLDSEGLRLVGACTYSPRQCHPNPSDRAAPRTEADIKELAARIEARLEAVAWETAKLQELHAWANDNPDKGVQITHSLRVLAEYGAGKHQDGRE